MRHWQDTYISPTSGANSPLEASDTLKHWRCTILNSLHISKALPSSTPVHDVSSVSSPSQFAPDRTNGMRSASAFGRSSCRQECIRSLMPLVTALMRTDVYAGYQPTDTNVYRALPHWPRTPQAWACYTEKATPARHRPERQYNACDNRRKQCSPDEIKSYSNPTPPRSLGVWSQSLHVPKVLVGSRYHSTRHMQLHVNL